MKTSEVMSLISNLEELSNSSIAKLEGWDGLLDEAVDLAEKYIEKQAKLERCLDLLEEVHETLSCSEHLGVISELLHDLGRYKKSE